MGFFDKLKTLVGAHGCKVEITRLERQAPDQVTFPATDSVFKGNYKITAEKPCTILAHKHQIVVTKKHADGHEETVVLGESAHDASTNIGGSENKWPYDMVAGDEKTDSFMVSRLDIPAMLKKLGYSDPSAAMRAPNLTFFVRITADVKGTPMDAEAKVNFKIAA
jgi:hypothetical protein